MKCLFKLSLQICVKYFLIVRRSERDAMKTVYRSLCEVTLFPCLILMELEISQQIFEKYSNINFHRNPSNGRRVVPGGRTDGQT